jgi:hypothetical protein
MAFVLLWCQAFALTCALEAAVALPLLRPPAPSPPFGWGRRVAAVFVVNLASHPAVWFVFPELGAGHPDLTLALSELWAFGSELLIYRLVFPFPALSWRRAAVTAGLANAVSFATGWALRATAQWP